PGEDQILLVAAPGVLANDTDVDAGDTKTVVAVNAQSAAVGTPIALASGAVLTVQADGSYRYDPHGKFAYLHFGEIATDSFQYSLRDSAGAIATATVAITIRRVTPLNSLSGCVYVDVNNDGFREAPELGLPQVFVRLEGPVT